jgi:hypothetical protein
MYDHRDSPSHHRLAQCPLVDVPVLLFVVTLGILEQIATRETCILILEVGMMNKMMMMTMMSRMMFSLLNKAYN